MPRTTSAIAQSPPFELATLDLDTMARIAEEAGRDAVLGRAAEATAGAEPAPHAALTAAELLATSLYRACHRGATDPAAD